MGISCCVHLPTYRRTYLPESSSLSPQYIHKEEGEGKHDDAEDDGVGQ